MSEIPTSPDCTVFGRCGGCSSLDVPYTNQLASKDEEVSRLFDGIVKPGAIRPILGMGDPFHYRNKIIAPFVHGRRGKGSRHDSAQKIGEGLNHAKGQKPGKGSKGRNAHGAPKTEILSGMYERGSHKVIDSGACPLENDVAARVVAAIKSIMRRHDIQPYDEDSGSGFLRHAVIRIGHNSGEVLVALVTNSEEFPYAKSFCRELVRQVPEITTVVQSVNTRQTNVVLGEKTRPIYGPGFILDELCGLSFRISPTSFYQVNARQTEVLYETAMELAALEGDELVIDAYCGTGTIGLVAASRGAGRVIGVDSEASSIRDARQNARHNGIENATFVAADATEFLAGGGLDEAGFEADGRPVVLFMDPPRAGSTPEFLSAAAALRPDKIVYISCNPQTQARDIRQLAGSGYKVSALQPVDMFPHTPHIETVALLEVDDG